ncbi:MAG: hypothetical protein AB7N99_04620 [Simkaniaceae bacterium]
MTSIMSSFCTFLCACNPFYCCSSSSDVEEQHLQIEYQSLSRDRQNVPLLYEVSFKVNVQKVSSIYDQMRSDLQGIDHRLSPSVSSRASQTITDMEKISQSLGSITSLRTDELRNREINTITRAGAEGGFSASPEVLRKRVEVFTATYQTAKLRGDLNGFFSCFSNGDPCLSGRSESLYKYSATLDGIDVDAIPDPEKKLYLPGTVFSEIIMGQFEEEAEEGSLTPRVFAEYVLQNIETVAAEFARFEKSPGGKAFLDLLDDLGIYRKGEPVNWEVLIERLAHSRVFDSVFRHSLTYVL